MKTTRNIILTLALCLAFAGTSMAMNHGKTAQAPEQQAVIDKAGDDFTAATKTLKIQLFAKESELNAQLYGEKTDDKKVEALIAEINALHGKIYAEKVKMQRVLAKEGILPDMGKGMGMMGSGGCPMMSGGGMKGMMGGMKHDKPANADDNGTVETPAAEGGHAGHAPAKQ
jgi:zinc resistance-associated protein